MMMKLIDWEFMPLIGFPASRSSHQEQVPNSNSSLRESAVSTETRSSFVEARGHNNSLLLPYHLFHKLKTPEASVSSQKGLTQFVALSSDGNYMNLTLKKA